MPKITKQQLKQDYLVNNLTMTAIAKKYNCSIGYISVLIKRYNLKINTIDKYMNKKFGLLEPTGKYKHELINKQKYPYFMVECKCECGNIGYYRGCCLLGDNTKSCGCKSRKKGKEHGTYRGYEEISSTIWHSLQRGAKIRNLAFDVTIEYAWHLFITQNRKCSLTGLNIVFADCLDNHRSGLTTASFDRINPNLGYINGNVRWIHKKINYLKMQLTDEEFIKWCGLVTDYNRKT